MTRPYLLSLCAAALSACSGSPFAISPTDVRFSIDRSVYIAVPQPVPFSRYEFQLIARLENRAAIALYLPRCYPDSRVPIYAVPLVEEAAARMSGYNPTWACVGHDVPIELTPGAMRIDTLRIIGPTAVQHGTNVPLGQLEGQFELVYSASACPPAAKNCPSESQLTLRRRFTVQLQR